jgi:hypothetical protein
MSAAQVVIVSAGQCGLLYATSYAPQEVAVLDRHLEQRP